jgi:hypothetical protein
MRIWIKNLKYEKNLQKACERFDWQLREVSSNMMLAVAYKIDLSVHVKFRILNILLLSPPLPV